MRIEELVYYSPDSPSGLRWKLDRFSSKRLRAAQDSVAGSRKLRGHWQVKLNGKLLLTHRVVWELVNGPLQDGEQIDHIDQDPTNNKVENLRKVSHTLNMRNRPKLRTNSSGTTGVHSCDVRGNAYWVAQWNDLTGKRRNAWYSVTKLGSNTAFERACERRSFELARLNSSGAGYTLMHGGAPSTLSGIAESC